MEKIIPKDELIEGWYVGHTESRFHIAYYDSKNKEFATISRKFDELVIKTMGHWDDSSNAAFGPVKYIGKEYATKKIQSNY